MSTKRNIDLSNLKNRLFFVSGASGSGKTFFMDEIAKELKQEDIVLSPVVSVTTRKKRVGEKDGEDYYFVTEERFQEMKDNNELIEDVAFGGNNYGITAQELHDKLSKGMAYIIVTIEGVEQISQFYKHWTSIFIDSDVLENIERMRSRGDSDENILKRIEQQLKELKDPVFVDKVEKYYEYRIFNKQGKADSTLAGIKEIVKKRWNSESGD